MSAFHLKIATPDGNVFDDPVSQLILRGSEGDLAILTGHIPFATGVQPGSVKLTLEDGSELLGHTEGVLLTVGSEHTTLLSSSFRWEETE